MHLFTSRRTRLRDDCPARSELLALQHWTGGLPKRYQTMSPRCQWTGERRRRSADKNRQSVNNLTIFIVIFYTPFYLWPKIEGNVIVAIVSLCAHFFALSDQPLLHNNIHQYVFKTTISNLALHSCNINKLLHGPFILVTETRTTSYLNSWRSLGVVVHSSHLQGNSEIASRQSRLLHSVT